MDCQENTTYFIKMVEYDKHRLKSKQKPKYVKKETSFCVGCREKNQKIKTNNNRLFIQSKCPKCGIKKSRFVKKQEAKGLLSNLGIKTPLS